MSYRCQDIVWDYVRPSSSFQNTGTYAPPSTPRVHAFAAGPRTEPADCKTQPPVGGIGTDISKGRRNPYRGGLGSFKLRFTYLSEGGHQVSRSPGPGSYETRHLTGGALVKRPKTASPCFRRPGGRLRFEGGGAWHEETPLETAERRGTVRGSLKTQPQHYSLSFRSKADRLVVNKPAGTTHEGIGPGCYDVSKDGKSVGVKTEKRVVRGGCAGKGSTNQFLVDWRAYMRRPPTANDGYGDCGCVGNDGASAGYPDKAQRSPPPVRHNATATPQTASYTLKSQSECWPTAKKQPPVAACRRRKTRGPGLRLRESGQTPRAAPPHQHRQPQEEEEGSFFPRQQPQHGSRSPVNRREKRPASAVASLRIPSTTDAHAPPKRCSGFPPRSAISGGRSGSGSVLAGVSGDCSGSYTAVSLSSAGYSGQPQFVPRPPSVDVVSRPRTACSAPAASQGINNRVDSRCSGDGRQGGEQRGATQVCPPLMDVPLDQPVVEKYAVTETTSPPVETVHHAARLPPTATSSRPEKADVAACSERPPGDVENYTPGRASRPILPVRPRPPDNSTVRRESPRGEDSSGKDTSGVVGCDDEPVVGVMAAGTRSDAIHCLSQAGHPVDVGREGFDQHTTVPSSGLVPGASSGRMTSSSPRSRGRSPSPESTDSSCSSREAITRADTRRPSTPPPSMARPASGTAVDAPILVLATAPPAKVAPGPPLPNSTMEGITRKPSTGEASSSSAAGGGHEDAVAAFFRIQSKNSFASILGIVERRSTASSRSSSVGIGSMSDDLDIQPGGSFSGAGGPRHSSHGSRNNSKSHSSAAGSAEQHDMPRRSRYKSFQVRQDSILGAVPERPRVDPFAARLLAARTSEQVVSGGLSAAVATHLAGVPGVGGSRGSSALVSSTP